jgi:hypothetical protein
MGFEPPPFQRFGPVDVRQAMRSGVAQEFVPLVLQREALDSVSGPAVELVGKQQGLRGGGFAPSLRGRLTRLVGARQKVMTRGIQWSRYS